MRPQDGRQLSVREHGPVAWWPDPGSNSCLFTRPIEIASSRSSSSAARSANPGAPRKKPRCTKLRRLGSVVIASAAKQSRAASSRSRRRLTAPRDDGKPVLSRAARLQAGVKLATTSTYGIIASRGKAISRRGTPAPIVCGAPLALCTKGVMATGRVDFGADIISIDLPRHVGKSFSQPGRSFENPVFIHLPD